MVSSMMSSRFGEGFRRPSDREDIVYRDRGQLGLYTQWSVSLNCFHEKASIFKANVVDIAAGCQY
jgi:hypothetical protein